MKLLNKTPRSLMAIKSSAASLMQELDDLQDFNSRVAGANDVKIALLKQRNDELQVESAEAQKLREALRVD